MSYRNPQIIVDRSAEIWAQGVGKIGETISAGITNYYKAKKLNYKIIGSAHNFRELNLKIRQKCNYILLSKLFSVDYAETSQFLDIVKFSKYLNFFSSKIIPLGGIKSSNLNKLKNLKCVGFALLSEIKKKPANIINRLF